VINATCNVGDESCDEDRDAYDVHDEPRDVGDELYDARHATSEAPPSGGRGCHAAPTALSL